MGADGKLFGDAKTFWSNTRTSRVVNVSSLNLLGPTFVDIMFKDSYLSKSEGFIFFRCSTSSRSPEETARNAHYGSLRISTKPKQTQMFPGGIGMDVLGELKRQKAN